MAPRNPRAAQAEPPRPRCATCGNPGSYFVTLEVKEMKLEREAGISSRPYWAADYRSGTKLEVVLCDGCQRNNVSVTAAVSATMEHAKERS